ncbi:MAG: hypothetical protein AUH45_10145 [Gemmatimonadetes bacterium 13_1_40CM_69_22]|nr:MAG: hypothetical protein AUH45_10145 [Gemmatimonadetes bacterium 13_1_40CM_69_22]
MSPTRTPLVLLANAHEWSARSLESILGPAGYAVIRAHTGEHALERARAMQPDVIVLDVALPEGGGLAVCRALRASRHVSVSTPIFLTTTEPIPRRQLFDALRAGACDLWAPPVDAEEVLLRLETHLRAKLDADRAREDSLVDAETGLYNARGLTRRARELAGQAARHNAALACVVLAPALSSADRIAGHAAREPAFEAVISQLTVALRSAGRGSDAIGRLGRIEFAVLAPDTDASGARRLGERLARAVEADVARRAGGAPPLKLRAGYYAVGDVRDAPLDPDELLARATSALRAPPGDLP